MNRYSRPELRITANPPSDPSGECVCLETGRRVTIEVALRRMLRASYCVGYYRVRGDRSR